MVRMILAKECENSLRAKVNVGGGSEGRYIPWAVQQGWLATTSGIAELGDGGALAPSHPPTVC